MQSSSESFWSEIKSLEERLKNDPASYCFAPLVEVYLSAGLFDDALAVARAGVIRYPGYVAGQMALARVCHQKSLVDECRHALEVVTGAVPEHAEAQRLLARLYVEAGWKQEARHALKTLLEFYPDDPDARLELDSLQLRCTAAPSEEELELIEFTDADIVEEFEEQDLLVERVKPVVPVVEDPWSAIDTTLVSDAVEVVPELESVWSVPEQQFTAAVAPLEQDPLTTPTLAELYVAQGFPDKAIEIYRSIVAADALNQGAVSRLAELEQPVYEDENDQAAVAVVDDGVFARMDLPVTTGAAEQQAVVTVLEGWLENIRRLRVCH
jgi:tetratricopeptide (TPR) repeat protein